MKTFILTGILAAFACQCPAQDTKVFVDADNGFNFYLTAAMAAKHVSATVVTDKNMADYALEGVSDVQRRLGLYGSIIYDWTAPLLPQSVHSNSEASIRLVNLRTSEVVFAFSVDRNNALHGKKSIAEDCAKHLKSALPPTPGALASSGRTGNGFNATAKNLLLNRKDPVLDF
jgi:hypothetical protein